MANDPLNPDLGGPRDASGLNPGVQRNVENPLDRVAFQERALKESRKGDDMARFAQIAQTLGPIAGQMIRQYGDQNLLQETGEAYKSLESKLVDIHATETELQQQIERAGSIEADVITQGAGSISAEDQDYLNNFKQGFQKLQTKIQQVGASKLQIQAEKRALLNQAISDRPWLSRQLQSQFQLQAGGPVGGSTSTNAANSIQAAQQLQIAQSMFGKTTLTADEAVQLAAYQQLEARQKLEPLTTSSVEGVLSTKGSVRLDSLTKKSLLEFQTNGFVDKSKFLIGLNDHRLSYTAEIDKAILEARKSGIFISTEVKTKLLKQFEDQIEAQTSWVNENDFAKRLEAMNKAQEQLLINGKYGKADLVAPLITSLGPAGGVSVASGVQRIFGNPTEAKAIALLGGLGPDAGVNQVADLYIDAISEVSKKDSIIPPGFEAFHAYVATQVMNSGSPEDVGSTAVTKHATALNQATGSLKDVADSSEIIRNFNDPKKLVHYSAPKNSEGRAIMVNTVDRITAQAKTSLVDKIADGYRLEQGEDGSVSVFKVVGFTPELQAERVAAGLPPGNVLRTDLGDVFNEILQLKNNPSASSIFSETGDQWLQKLLKFQADQIKLLEQKEIQDESE